MYNHTQTEKKWQKFWEENQTFRIGNDFSKPKYYCLDMFPYPSGAGLHVGHPEGMTANDIVARYKHAKGYNVLHPMGWDAFGLPAENYAIKTGTHPRITTDQNIDNFRRQIKELGFSYDWSREIDTTDPKYYKWTQWIFLKLFEKGLAYEQDLPINYCPSCKTGLANEEVLNDFTCERCGTKVEKRKIKQWVLAITKYAERLLADVDRLDWPESIKEMQRNWIGKSEGCEFEMKVTSPHSISPKGREVEQLLENLSISVYTTRIDTVFGMTYAVLAPDHKDVLKFITEEQKESCLEYIENSKKKSDQDRTADNKEKTGVFTGSYAINPFSGEKVPLWIGDYVLGNYGTGAVMAVPAHDLRDFEFAKKYGLYCFPTIYPKEYLDLVKIQENPDIDSLELDEITKKISLLDSEMLDKAFIEDGYININYPISLEIPNNIKKSKDRERYFQEKFDYQIELQNKYQFLSSSEARKVFTQFAEKNNFGKKKVNYKLRDWLFSRQRYWGEPIPLIHLDIEDLKKLPHIDEEAFNKLKNNIKNIINKKMRDAPLEFLESDTPMGTSANLSIDYSIIETIQKVKKKSRKNFKLKSIFDIFKNQDKSIRVSGKYLILHFKEKSRYDFLKRLEFSQTIIENIDKVCFVNDYFGLLNVNGKVWVVIIEKVENNIYDLVTYYNFKALNNFSDTAYILKRNPLDSESSFGASTCSGKVRELIIGGKVFSKIYDGIYSKIVCDYNLPLELPQVQNYEPSGDGNSPLSKVPSFVNVKLAENLVGKRETNTMPQWGGSCWYYLRYMDPHNSNELVNKEVVNYWGEVDSYVGGAEHAVLHLLYARFWHKFLFDIGVVPTNEPFGRLRNQGLILAHAFERKNGGLLANDLVEEKAGKFYEISTGEEVNRIVSKMSKSLKNVVNPDEIVKEFGADSLRLYEMYMADFKDSAPWDSKGIIGVRRFLEKVERAFDSVDAKICENDDEAIKLLHKTIKKVEEDINNYKFNTAIAAMMILVNYGRPKDEKKFMDWKQKFAIILHPFAPHLAEELWENYCDIETSIYGVSEKKDAINNISTNSKNSIFFAPWPEYDENLVKDDVITIGVQVLGKLRGTIEIGVDEDEKTVLQKAKSEPNVAKWIDGKELVKEIYVKGKIVNLVIK